MTSAVSIIVTTLKLVYSLDIDVYPVLQDDKRRGEFFAKMSDLISQLINYAPVDAAADQVTSTMTLKKCE